MHSIEQTETNSTHQLHSLNWQSSIHEIRLDISNMWQRRYSISQEICTRLLLCCALLWLYIYWFSHITSGLLHWHCGNLTIAPVLAKQPWWIWINTCEFIMHDCINHNKAKHDKTVCIFLGIYCISLTTEAIFILWKTKFLGLLHQVIVQLKNW